MLDTRLLRGKVVTVIEKFDGSIMLLKSKNNVTIFGKLEDALEYLYKSGLKANVYHLHGLPRWGHFEDFDKRWIKENIRFSRKALRME